MSEQFSQAIVSFNDDNPSMTSGIPPTGTDQPQLTTAKSPTPEVTEAPVRSAGYKLFGSHIRDAYETLKQ
jgi:hypothetical protein